MRNRMYGGVRGKETKIGRKTFVSLPTRFTAITVVPFQFFLIDSTLLLFFLYLYTSLQSVAIIILTI